MTSVAFLTLVLGLGIFAPGAVSGSVDCSSMGGDADGDGICQDLDNCDGTPNPGQDDADTDDIGDACDTDDDRRPDCNGLESTIWYNDSSSTDWSTIDGTWGTITDWPNVTFDGPGWTVSATTGNDVIWGSPERDVIKAARGDDTVCGNDGGDVLLGSFGFDWLNGNDGEDFIYGGHHHDTLLCGGVDATGDGDQDAARGGWGLDTFLNCDEAEPEEDNVKQGQEDCHKKDLCV